MNDSPFGQAVPLGGFTVARPVFRRVRELSKPTVFPIDLNTLKSHLRITDNYSDQYLTMLIETVTGVVEQYLSKRLISRQVEMWMDYFPGKGSDYSLYGAGTAQIPVRFASIGMDRWFDLYGTPVTAFDSFKFITLDDVEHTFDPANYLVDHTDLDAPARVILRYSAVWPINLQVAHAIKMTYTLGYGPVATDVPSEIRHAVMIAASALWSNRGDGADQPADILQLPGIRSVLDPFRIRRI